MDYWISANHPLYEKPGVKIKDSEGRIRQIWRYSYVKSAGESYDQYERVWWGKKSYFVTNSYLEPLYDLVGGVRIPDEMASSRLEKQFVFIDGRQKFNQCGQFDAMWCAGVGPEVFYPALKSKNSGLYKAHVTQDKVTGVSALVAFCQTLGLGSYLDHEVLPVQTPRLIDEYMRDTRTYLIAGIDIDPYGRVWSPLAGVRKIPHWITIVAAGEYANRMADGRFVAYEPYRNGMIQDVRWTDIRPALFVEYRRA